jgi:acetoin:2,6-dichlorophenolindophenol oxidoreductase subunit alpha
MDKEIAYDIIKVRISQMMVNQFYKDKKFQIPIHLAFGHETIAVALDRIMEETDKLLLSHRNIAFNLARGKNLKQILNEYFLKEDSLCKGKLGSMNLMNLPKGIIYTSSILGNNFSVATGVALAQKIKSEKGITIVLGGDGSMEEGSFHESLLMAKSLKLPCFIIIENNEWSMATRINERRCDVNLEKFSSAYGIKYAKFSGNNPIKYIENLKTLRDYAINNNEPVCIEFDVTTLGDWIMKHDDYPNGKFINYHAGPAPEVDLETCPAVIKTSEQDPVYALKQIIDESEIIKLSEMVRLELKSELS